jgi:hypothetical protein
VKSIVPPRIEPGETYDVSVELRDGRDWVATDAISYDVGTRGDAEITELSPDSGPAGSIIRVRGKNLLVYGEMPTVTLSDGTDEVEARVFGMMPSFGKWKDELLVEIPKTLEDGEYDLVVTIGDESTEAATFTVKTNALTVRKLWPDTLPARGFPRPIFISGTGFGNRGTTEIEVTFDDGSGSAPLTGRVLLQMDSELLVSPPGGFKDPLPAGTYEVRVIRDPDGIGEWVKAGEIVVK